MINMCGIAGYVGSRDARTLLMESLENLEYRGYDSAGLALYMNGQIHVIKTTGRVSNLTGKMIEECPTTLGIGHTRWATHGTPSDLNAQPLVDCHKKIAVAHNGIIDNYVELKEWLISKGHVFRSETDSEVIPHLVEEYYMGDLKKAALQAISQLKGSYAIAIIHVDHPDTVVAICKGIPLIIGLNDSEVFIASDLTGLMAHVKKTISLRDEDLAIVRKNSVEIFDFTGAPVLRNANSVSEKVSAVDKKDYEHFMIKEIHDQPYALSMLMNAYLDEYSDMVRFDSLKITAEDLSNYNKIFIIGCGSSYHAALMGKIAIESMAGIMTFVEYSSEIVYHDSLIDDSTIVIAISQSGETADTITAVKHLKSRGCKVIAITNFPGSALSTEADHTLYMNAGREISVAATKTFTNQVVLLYLVAAYLSSLKGKMSPPQVKDFTSLLRQLPVQVNSVLENKENICSISRLISNFEYFMLIGRNHNIPIAMEGALKMKEISYLPSDGLASGELKHGPLALITSKSLVIALATKGDAHHKVFNNIKEVKTRSATVVGIATENDRSLKGAADHLIYVPDMGDFLTPILSIVVLQLIAYYVARNCGCEIDMPRNLAKSVTVE